MAPRRVRRMRFNVPARVQYVLVAIVCVAAVAVALLALRQPAPPKESGAPQEPSASTAAAKPLRFTVFGDSYTGGSAMGGIEDAGWPRIVAKDLGLEPPAYSAEGGTGYVNPGPAGGAGDFEGRVDDVIATSPDFLVVAGGLNDADFDLKKVTAAARKVFTELQAGLPDATIVVVGPFSPKVPAPADITAIRDALQQIATELDIAFVDPLPWFKGGDAVEIGSDGVHPTDAGHAQIAARMDAALKPLLPAA